MYTGEKIGLRDVREEDVLRAWELVNDPDVKRYLHPGIPFPIPLHEEKEWLHRQSAFNNDGKYNFAIELLESGEYIGGCGVNQVDWKNRYAVVGIFLGKPYWNKGYGTDAMNVLVRFIFEQMNMNKVQLFTYAFNPRAIRSYEKCGFKVEGILRQHIFRDGAYHDEYVMSILHDEYVASKK
ncbi:GNAT family N-acetyltransferase [Rubeoparvulum massiliense]|uniref:GNAT family N-acetyltransferase n=1 Tax=Rubeoparvulum massiliense TaxID=1631346 RepID=UPI00065E3353|nr:GNAT family protein [Rubeoparvulum massiliense]